jgi:hypothetical protein
MFCYDCGSADAHNTRIERPGDAWCDFCFMLAWIGIETMIHAAAAEMDVIDHLDDPVPVEKAWSHLTSALKRHSQDPNI